MPIEYMFCFVCSEQCIKIISTRKSMACLVLYSVKFHVFLSTLSLLSRKYVHTGKCIRRFGGIYAYCRYFIDRKW